ncbi:MAG TPA: IPT/TIG domain-containing protein [Bryobacteraceae bacterium]|nr:IPT/TIG domain-containing protein [Bryobacteraceae bacterium]
MCTRQLSLCGSVLLIASVSFAQTPTIQSNGVVSGGGSSRMGVAPGSLISIFGTDLASGLSSANSIPLSTNLGDVTSVTIGGTAAPLVLVSAGRINAQVPFGVAAGPADVVVNRGGASSAPQSVVVSQFAPALFSLNLGTLQAIATNADGSLVAPAGAIPGISSHPAAAGDTVTLFATGLGPVTPAIADGMLPGDTPRLTANPVTVLIGAQPGTVSMAGLSSQFVGVYQLNVVVPGGVTGAAAPVQVQMSDAAISDPVTIALQ